MESLLKQLRNKYHLLDEQTIKEFNINLGKLSKETITRIFDPSTITRIFDPSNISTGILAEGCDISKLEVNEFIEGLDLNNESFNSSITIFRSIVEKLSLEEMKSIEFEKFNDSLQRAYLYDMISNSISAEKICVLLDKMKSINYGGHIGVYKKSDYNPLMFCCILGKMELVKLLIEKYNADIEYSNYYTQTAIMFAAQKNHKEIVKYLYDKGANIKTINQYATEEIINLIRQWESEKKSQINLTSDLILIKEILDRHKTINTDHILRKILEGILSSISLENMKIIEFEKLGDDVQKYCLIYMMEKNFSREKICVLLDKMKSVNYGEYHDYETIRNYSKINPLIFCCWSGKMDLVKLLVETYKADIELLSYNDTTAIMFAAQSYHPDIVKYLYDKGAKLATKTQNINTFATVNGIKGLIEQWESEKKKANEMKEKSEKYEKLKSELEKMKSTLDTMKNDIEADTVKTSN